MVADDRSGQWLNRSRDRVDRLAGGAIDDARLVPFDQAEQGVLLISV